MCVCVWVGGGGVEKVPHKNRKKKKLTVLYTVPFNSFNRSSLEFR